MKENLETRGIKSKNFSKAKERAALLAESINELKNRAITVGPYEPIEGKMFWPEEI